MKRKIIALLVMLAVLALALPTAAQEGDGEVLVSGLNNPRGIAYDENGVLYIAESGLGGEIPSQGPFGPATAGFSAGVSVFAEGETQALIQGLPSLNDGQDIVGASAVLVDSSLLWIVTGHEIPNVPTASTVMGLDRVSLRQQQFIDVFAYEAENNPDGAEVLSNVNDIAADDAGNVYIVDASGNVVYRWTFDGGLEPFAVWTDNPVPTTVAIGADGNIYVGFLTGFPFPAGGSRIEVYSPEGELVNTISGLTAVTDILFSSTGTLYAVQYAGGFDPAAGGWTPDSGAVVVVGEDGTVTPLVEGLNRPYALAEAPDGRIAVTVNTSSLEAGQGEVRLYNAAE